MKTCSSLSGYVGTGLEDRTESALLQILAEWSEVAIRNDGEKREEGVLAERSHPSPSH